MKLLRRPLAHYIALTSLFFLLVLLLPASAAVMNDYNVSETQYRILLFIYVLPYAGIWFTAFFAYSKLRQYVKSIDGSPETEGYRKLKLGCGWLAYSLPALSIFALALFGLANINPDIRPLTAILSNYVTVILPLIAFLILGKSARTLNKQAGLKLSPGKIQKILAGFIVLGLIYCVVLLRNLSLTSISSADNPYFLPFWLVLLTVTLPYLFTWFVGLLAAYEFIVFSRHSKGVLYRQALRYLGIGIAVVITSSIAVQYLAAVAPRSGDLSVNSTLATAYIIQILAAAGYIMIAFGANKLKRIEEV